ncbi:Queuine tRNA-ribosyltransferase accessory subunit 2 [Geodia barretti]|nr:Queuine tRNA-ribosyltransferase accessory subunit 2 [Geodia barretti]
MKLFLEKITSSGGRVGRLVWCTESAQSVLETPLCLPYTRAGAIPHIVQSVYQDLSPRPTAAMLTLPSLYELPGSAVLKEYDYGIHNFLNMKDQFLYLSIQDPHCPPRSGFNEEKSTSVWTNGGRMKVSVAGYMEFVRASRPNVFESLCDSVSSQTNKLKRVRKSVDRTLRFLDQTLAMRQNCQVLEECGLLGAVVGGDVYEERVRSATETVKRPVDGFVIEGFDLEHSHECYQSILQSATSVLPQSSPRFIHGVYSPGDILTAVESGVDVFDSACVLTATENGCAFTFHNSSSDCVENRRENRGATENIAAEPPSHQIDLNDEK